MIETNKLYYHKSSDGLSFFWMDRIEGKSAYGWQISFLEKSSICHFFLNDRIQDHETDFMSHLKFHRSMNHKLVRMIFISQSEFKIHV